MKLIDNKWKRYLVWYKRYGSIEDKYFKVVGDSVCRHGDPPCRDCRTGGRKIKVEYVHVLGRKGIEQWCMNVEDYGLIKRKGGKDETK